MEFNEAPTLVPAQTPGQREENIAALIAALESGEFQKTRFRLASVRGDEICHCAIGAACEVFRQRTGKGQWRWASDGTRSQMWFDLNGDLTVSKVTLDYYGLGESTTRRIIEVNDWPLLVGMGWAPIIGILRELLPVQEKNPG